MQATRELARWSAETPKLTSGVALARARDGIYDVVACMVAGAGDAGSARVRATIAPYGSGHATVIGGRDEASAPWAALANGMAAHALDFDDNYIPAYTHATAVLIPALLAVAEEIDASGEQLVDAYIVGLEMHCAIGRGVNRAHYDRGWHGTSTVGCIGTAAACGRLLGLDADQMTQAISLAVSMASGPKVQFGTMAKPFHAGMGAKNAVLAAHLAATTVPTRRWDSRLNLRKAQLGSLYRIRVPPLMSWRPARTQEPGAGFNSRKSWRMRMLSAVELSPPGVLAR